MELSIYFKIAQLQPWMNEWMNERSSKEDVPQSQQPKTSPSRAARNVDRERLFRSCISSLHRAIGLIGSGWRWPEFLGRLPGQPLCLALCGRRYWKAHCGFATLSDGAKLAAPFLLFWLHAIQVAWRNETSHQQGILQPRGSWIPRSLLANANWRLSAVEKTTPKEAMPVKDRNVMIVICEKLMSVRELEEKVG